MIVMLQRADFGKVLRKLRTDKAVSRLWVVTRIKELGYEDPISTAAIKFLETGRRKKPTDATLTQLTAVFPALAEMFPLHG